jgi:hypothetical protein
VRDPLFGQETHWILAGSGTYFEAMDNDSDKTLAGAFTKKQAPRTLVTDKTLADYDLGGTTSEVKHSSQAQIATLALGEPSGGLRLQRRKRR